MTEIDSPLLNGLEHQITNLLESCENLKAENRSLRQQLSNSLRERSKLIETTQTAQTQIKKVIATLKEQYHERS